MRSDPLLSAAGVFLALVGLPMLFLSEEILGTAGSPGTGLAGGRLAGELLGPAWLGFAALSWFSRGSRVGGIYGRPLMTANLLLFAPSALTFFRAAWSKEPPAASGALSGDLRGGVLWGLGAGFSIFALLFLRRLFRPLDTGD